MYEITRQTQRQQLDGLGELDGWLSKTFKKILPIAAPVLSVFNPALGLPLMAIQKAREASQAAAAQKAAAESLLASPAIGSVPSGDVALARALAAQQAAAPIGSVPSGDVALRRAMGGEDPEARTKRLLMYGGIAVGGLAAVALVASLASRRRD